MDIKAQDPWTLHKMIWVARACRGASVADVDSLIRECEEAIDASKDGPCPQEEDDDDE